MLSITAAQFNANPQRWRCTIANAERRSLRVQLYCAWPRVSR